MFFRYSEKHELPRNTTLRSMQTRIKHAFLLASLFALAFSSSIQAQINVSIDVISPLDCQGALAEVEALASGDNAPFSFAWDTGDTTALVNLNGGDHSVTVTDNLGFTIEESITIDPFNTVEIVIQTPDSTLLCTKGTETIANLTLTVAETGSYEWSTMDTGASITVEEMGEYGVTVTDVNGIIGCTAMDTVLITRCPDFRIPNAFTPNGDDLNDTFGPVTVGAVNILQFRIYNRWGQMVYEALDQNGWDGTIDGDAAPSGVYIYFMELELDEDLNMDGFNDKCTEQGDITLIR